MESRCRAGDLAVVIRAHYSCNLGRIVRVLAPHDGMGDRVFHNAGVVWLVECAQPMTWSIGKKRFRRKRGPAPDSCLKPIRGTPSYAARPCQESLRPNDLKLHETVS